MSDLINRQAAIDICRGIERTVHDYHSKNTAAKIATKLIALEPEDPLLADISCECPSCKGFAMRNMYVKTIEPGHEYIKITITCDKCKTRYTTELDKHCSVEFYSKEDHL